MISNKSLLSRSIHMDERLVKFGLYFRDSQRYWKLSGGAKKLAVDIAPLRQYPLDLTPRLDSGHFAHFDEIGLPVRMSSQQKIVHNYTTICCFALAHWEKYLVSADEALLKPFLLAADYLVRTGESRGNIVRLRREVPGKGHTGEVSSIVQGEAISVLCRAWRATGHAHYLETAIACSEPFFLSVADDGVVSRLPVSRMPWYEEFPALRPAQHVLNGMVYALWGLRELAVIAGSPKVKRAFETGVESVLSALPQFDTGFWSWYALPEAGRPYIASMMYHSLHICQLAALAEQTGAAEFSDRARNFAGYSRNPVFRFQAGCHLLRAKLSRS